MYILNQQPKFFPTHRHIAEHWEWLGRAVGTFGFLEDVLRRAIFAITGTQTYATNVEAEAALEKWADTLINNVLGLELGGLILSFVKAVKDNPNCKVENFDDLVVQLNKAKELRNLLSHASWQVPNDEGKALPHFIRRRDKQVNLTKMDADYLREVQLGTAELCCAIMSIITSMGWQFPGSNGPRNPVW